MEDQMKRYEERIVEVEWELKDSRDGWSADLTRYAEDLRVKEEELRAKDEELQAKEEESTTKEAGAYVNTRNDLMAELRKRYPKEDFSWMNELAPEAEDESDEEPEREREDEWNVNVEQAGGDPPAEWLALLFWDEMKSLLFNFLMRSESIHIVWVLDYFNVLGHQT